MVPQDIQNFLGCDTPIEWLEYAAEHLDTLLVDHAQCEKKAAASALQLMFRYADDEELAAKMSKLAREELRHFEQVLKIMQGRGIKYGKKSAARYAVGLRDLIRRTEPGRLVDTLIAGAFIEARSCERFARLIPYLDQELAEFYRGLLESESRHYRRYLEFARRRTGDDISDRIADFRQLEVKLISEEDEQFRFHSGRPVAAAQA